MRVAKLYPTRPPDQQCLALISAVHKVSKLPGKECFALGMGLYDCQFDRESPAIFPIREESALEELEAVCAAAGIQIEMESL